MYRAAVRYVERNPVGTGLVEIVEACPRSSAAAHASGKQDDLLSPERPYPGPVTDWRAWLAEPEAEASAQTGALSDVFVSDGRTIVMRNRRYDMSLQGSPKGSPNQPALS